MKNFFALLLKGIGIALAVSLAICFFAWYWGNWRAIIWFVVGVIMIWQICKYLLRDARMEPIYDDNGKVLVAKHSASISEKCGELALGFFIITLLGGFLWSIGRFTIWMLSASPKIFELTIFIGILSILGVILLICILASIYFSFKTACWKLPAKTLPSLAKWILVIVISCLVAFGVLYLYLPPMH